MIYKIWDSFGWFILAATGAVWLFFRFQRRHEPHAPSPTWGLMSASVVMAFLLGIVAAAQPFSSVPAVMQNISWNNTSPNEFAGCAAEIDGRKITSFKKEYKVALLCVTTDPAVDQLSDTRILVSNAFEIVPAIIPVVGLLAPSGDVRIEGRPKLTINWFAILIPRDLPITKITSLADVLRQRGKILDAKYYK